MKKNSLEVLRHSPAILIASAALFVALGTGVGYAASFTSGRLIAPHSIPGNRLVDHSITGQQLAPRSLTITNLTLLHGWTSSQLSYGSGSPRVITNGTGIAYLAGSLHGGTSSEAFILPAGQRPGHTLYITIYTNAGTTGYLEIYTDGATFVGGSASRLYSSLASISFPIGH